MVKLTKNKKFEESYFNGYYKGIGDFSKERDSQLYNWFSGIFSFINKYHSFKAGEGKKLIEFGCATGAAAFVLKKYGYQVTSTDISNYAVSKAKKNYKGIKFLVHDLEKSYKKKEKFDVSIAMDVIEHLPNPEKGIKNVYNLLKDDGIAIFTTPNDYDHVWNDPTHINVKKPEEWRKIFKKVGFKDIEIRQATMIPYLYRFHPFFAKAFPISLNFRFVVSPVFIFAKK